MCIGFRCWGDKFSFVILDGDQNSPVLISCGQRKCPVNLNRAEELQWVRKEIHEILDSVSLEMGFYKGIENNSRTVDKTRCEFEGVIQEAAYSHRSKVHIQKRIKSQITSNTESGKPKYLGKLLEHDALKGLSKDKFEEACLVALCGLNN